MRPAPELLANLFPRDGQRLLRSRRGQYTDLEGFASWETIPPGRYDVLQQTIEVHGGGITDVTLEVPWGAAIRGTVVDTAGWPIPGALVASEGARTTTNEEGHFALRGAMNMAYVSATAEGYQRSTEEVISANEWTSRELTLHMAPGGASITGRVLTSDGALVSGVTVSAQELGRHKNTANLHYGTKQRRCVSDGTGHFQLAGLLPVSHRLNVRAMGLPRYEQTVEIEPTAQLHIDIRLPRPGALFGTVTDATGTPVAGADVAAYGASSSRDVVASMTNERGEFRFEHPPQSVTHLDANHEGAGSTHEDVKLRKGQPNRVDLKIPGRLDYPEPILSVQFVDAKGESLAWRPVTAFSDKAEFHSLSTDEQGSLTANQTEPWMTHLAIGDMAYVGRPVQTFRDVGQAKGPLTLVVDGGTGAIRGRVTDTEGRLPADASLHLALMNGVYSKLEPAEPNGTFEWKDVPLGAYEIRFQATGRATRMIPVNVIPGETLDLGELLSSPGGSVDLDLRGAAPLQTVNGRPAHIMVTPASHPGFVSRAAPLDPVATTVGPLPEGDLLLTVLAPGCALTHVKVRVRNGETTRATVFLEEGYAPPVRFILNGRPIQQKEGGGAMVLYDVEDLNTGSYVGSFSQPVQTEICELTPLAPGRYRVRAADHQGRQGEATIVVPVGGLFPFDPPALRLDYPR